MKYEILFTSNSNGVWTRHETLESAEKHIKMLTADLRLNHNWTIFCSGQVVNQSKKNESRRT